MLDFIRSVIESKYKTKMVVVEDDHMDIVIRVDFMFGDIHVVHRIDKNLFDVEFSRNHDIKTIFIDHLEVIVCSAIDDAILKVFKKE